MLLALVTVGGDLSAAQSFGQLRSWCLASRCHNSTRAWAIVSWKKLLCSKEAFWSCLGLMPEAEPSPPCPWQHVHGLQPVMS